MNNDEPIIDHGKGIFPKSVKSVEEWKRDRVVEDRQKEGKIRVVCVNCLQVEQGKIKVILSATKKM